MFNSDTMQRNSIACLHAYSHRSPQNYFHTHMEMMDSLVTEKENERSRENSLAGRLKNREKENHSNSSYLIRTDFRKRKKKKKKKKMKTYSGKKMMQ